MMVSGVVKVHLVEGEPIQEILEELRSGRGIGIHISITSDVNRDSRMSCPDILHN